MTEADRLVFGRYALPCAEGKLRADKITTGMFEELRRDVLAGIPPNPYLLVCCFPKAFEESLQFATSEEYWLYHHHHKDSPVLQGTVTGFIGRNEHDLFEVFTDENRTIPAVNAYDQAVRMGDRVSVHEHSIIQVLTNP